MIQRPLYTERLQAFRDKPLIKILTGVRRCGKSTLFRLFQEELLRDGVPAAQIQSINLEDVDAEALLDYHELHRHVLAHTVQGKQNYVFLDEIQNVPDFQRAVRSLMDKGNIDLYLTGSNSGLQSGDWASSITGRYIEIHVLPLSFREYVSAHPESTVSRDELYEQYLRFTSFPQALVFDDALREFETQRYLRDVYSSILLKDIVQRRSIKEVSRLEQVLRFLASSVGSEISAKKIRDILLSDGSGLSVNTVELYIRAFMDCFLLYQADRYDVKGKKLLKTLHKYYLVDMGMRRMLLGSRAGDEGHRLENIVFLELRRRGYQVYVGKMDVWDTAQKKPKNIEIDFVALGPNGPEYYQVAQSVLLGETRERELAPLRAIRDNYPKYLLTRDYAENDDEGIRHRNVLRWLLGES